LYAGIAINGSVSLSSALEVCVIPHYGLIVEGGVKGNILYWETSSTPFSFYNKDFVFGDKCFSSVQEPTASGSSRRSVPVIEHSSGVIPQRGTPAKRGAMIIESLGLIQREIEPSKGLNKRQTSAPAVPGLFSCPNVNGEIGEDDTDNDIYSDYPGNILDGTIKAYTSAVGYVNVNTYGREHVYEMQLLTDFINMLAQSPALWQNSAGNTNYCSWAETLLSDPSKYTVINQGQSRSVIDRLKSCQPSNTNSVIAGGNKMPWLESTANGIKARAFASTALRTSSTFKRYSYSKKVFNIRAAAGLVSYMLDGPVADQFVLVSECVRDVWSDFYNAYNADNSIDAPNRGNFNMVNTYHTYITMKVQTFFLNLKSGVTQMIGFYSASAGGNTNQKNVDLDYGTLSSNPMTPVSADDLTNSIGNPLSSMSLIKLTVRL
ncbi:hypothetical protein CVT26_006154, partial [Gymnopilus dilepis]